MRIEQPKTKKRMEKEVEIRELTPRQKRFLKGLESCLGIVTHAVKKTGIGEVTHYEWMKDPRYPQYRERVEQIKDATIDFAESQLYKRIKDGDTTAMIFFLKCKGKKRGYIEKQYIEAENRNTIELSEDLKNFMQGLTKK